MFQIDPVLVTNTIIQNMVLIGKAFVASVPWYGWIILGIAAILKFKTI